MSIMLNINLFLLKEFVSHQNYHHIFIMEKNDYMFIMKKIYPTELIFRKAAIKINMKIWWIVFKILTIYILRCLFCLIAYVHCYFFLTVVRNFIFLLLCEIHCHRSEKRKTSFEQDQVVSSFFSRLYVWIFSFLCFMCTHSWHFSVVL